MGARIEGAGSSTIEIEGVEALSGTSHAVIADRIELGTFMMAAAITAGDVTCQGGRLDLVSALAEKLDEQDINVSESEGGIRVVRICRHR